MTCLQGPDTLGAVEDLLQIYVNTPLGTGIAQLSLPAVGAFLQVRCLTVCARGYLALPACSS